MPKPLTYNAVIEERIDLTRSLSIFKVRRDEPGETSGRWFVPGQYVVLGMNNERRPELGSVRRAMSLASAPEQGELLEFYIRYVNKPESENPLTHILWDTAAGDRCYTTKKPAGRFTIDHTVGVEDRRIKLFVAAGTGLAPFMSIVRSAVLADPNADLREFVILHGASYPADLGYCDELESLAQRENGLRYYSSVSRPREAPEWSGDKGRVEDYFLPERIPELENRLGLKQGELNPERVAVYICGLQGTIGSTIERLAGRGFVPSDRKIRKALAISNEVAPTLFYEQYDNTPVIDIANPEVTEPLAEQIRVALSRLSAVAGS